MGRTMAPIPLNLTGVPYSAHQTANRKPHPTFQYKKTQQTAGARVPPSRQPNPQPAKSAFSHRTISTLYCFITGHAFVGEFTQCFFPQHTPEQIACECGEQLQTIEHILRDCPRFDTARRKHLTANGHLQNIPQMFSHPKRVQSLLQFLEETGACTKPRTMWDPG